MKFKEEKRMRKFEQTSYKDYKKPNFTKWEMGIAVITCERELFLLCGSEKSLMFDWNFFIISAIETNGVDWNFFIISASETNDQTVS